MQTQSSWKRCSSCHSHLAPHHTHAPCPHCGHREASAKQHDNLGRFAFSRAGKAGILAASLIGLTTLWGCPGTPASDGTPADGANNQEIREENVVQPPYGLPPMEFTQDGGSAE